MSCDEPLQIVVRRKSDTLCVLELEILPQYTNTQWQTDFFSIARGNGQFSYIVVANICSIHS